MPYYRWRGVDLTATIRKGTNFAHSENELDALLLGRDIALISSKSLSLWYTSSVSLPQFIAYFEHLSSLLHAGVPLPKALRLVADGIDHKRWGLIAQNIADTIAEGITFSDALAQFPDLFTPVMITTVETGLETGNLPVALDLLADYLRARSQIRKKLRTVIIMPLVTLSFFVVISLVLVLFLLPRFNQLLHSMHRDIPLATQRLLTISAFLSSYYGIATLLGLFILLCILFHLINTPKGKNVRDRLLIQIPFIRTLIYQANAGTYFQSLGILVSGGMHIVPALQLAHNATHNTALQNRLKAITFDVISGYSLSQALAAHVSDIANPDILAMIIVGEETGVMGPLLHKIAQEYQARLYKNLDLITTLVQPTLMIILGLFVTGLIMMIYTPIFNLSSAF